MAAEAGGDAVYGTRGGEQLREREHQIEMSFARGWAQLKIRRTVHNGIEIEAPAEAVFAWHTRAGALERLVPPWERLVVEEQEVDTLYGGAPDHRDPYLFTILARVKKDDRVAYVEETITEQ